MAAQSQTNFHFFLARGESVFNGIRASEVLDPYGERTGVIPSLVVGPQLRARGDKPVTWARVIPPGVKDIPRFATDGKGGEKIMSGSIVREGEKSYLVSHRDEQAYYVLVRTGLMSVKGSTAADRLAIQEEGALVTHGSYSFDHASIRVAMANNETTLRSALADPNASIGRVAAEMVSAKAMGGKIPLLGCPSSSYVMWKMPVGAVLLVREVNGRLSRLIAEKAELRRVDAAGYNMFFESLEENYKEIQAAGREARLAAKNT